MKSRKWYWAVLLTILLPGLGHMYAGRLARGAVLYATLQTLCMAAFLLGMLGSYPGLIAWIALMLAAYVLVAADVVRLCRTPGFRPKAYTSWFYYLLAFLVGMGVTTGLKYTHYFGTYSLRAYTFPSESMAATLLPGDQLYADMAYYDHREPQADDIIVMRFPPSPDLTYIKRIAAGPGDQVESDGGDFRVNGKKLDVYAHAPAGQRVISPGKIKYVLPPGKYFVLGDNFDHSQDSRHFGPIDREDILGRPLYIYYSPDFSRIGRKLP